MKFTFICIVIVISCSVCACNDLDIYSDLNFNYNKPKSVSRLPDYDQSGFYSKLRYPFDNVLPEDYDDAKIRDLPEYDSLPNKLQQIQEDIDWERSQLRKHRPHRESPLLQYYLNKLNKPERLDIPSLPRMEEPRMYTPEDDLGFRIDDEKYGGLFDDRIFENEFGNTERLIPNQISSDGTEELSHNHHEVHPNDKDSVEFTSNSFKNIGIMENPSEFAYAPSDPRFYRKVPETRNEVILETTTVKDMPVNSKNLPPEKIIVSPRSDQKPLDNDVPVPEENHKDGGIEVVPIQPNLTDVDSAGVYIIAIVAGISAAATVGLIAVGIGWYNLQKHVKNASDVEYPAYGVTGPNKDISPSGDRRLAQSAQMYHYQHQKQQIIAMERAPPGEQHGSVSEPESDEENEEGDYTVYECPGLAPTGEMEVKNPLFQDDPTPVQTPAIKTNGEEKN